MRFAVLYRLEMYGTSSSPVCQAVGGPHFAGRASMASTWVISMGSAPRVPYVSPRSPVLPSVARPSRVLRYAVPFSYG
jgi:hypothetical protein